MKIRFIIICMLIPSFIGLSSEVDLDYNYEYEKNGTFTKFSDWVPYKLHKWNPHFLEDYYELYGLKLHHDENEIRRNIYFLKIALQKRFRHPRNALCKIKDENEYYKYRLLLFMHINYAIMRSYMNLGSKYDKRHLYFYNLDFAHDLKKSFTVAKSFYQEAVPYWEKMRDYALLASKLKMDLDLGQLESNRHEIYHRKLDYGFIIQNHLRKVDSKLNTIDEYLAKYPEADKPNIDF